MENRRSRDIWLRFSGGVREFKDVVECFLRRMKKRFTYSRRDSKAFSRRFGLVRTTWRHLFILARRCRLKDFSKLLCGEGERLDLRVLSGR
jgi:hypothetical protein